MIALVLYSVVVVAIGCDVLNRAHAWRRWRYYEAREWALKGCAQCLARLERARERAGPCGRHPENRAALKVWRELI
jgi:hypothetical protein